MMETIRTKEPPRIRRFCPSFGSLDRARWAAMELKTWILGKIFVGVSAWYSSCTATVKILWRSKLVGRSRCPLGNRVEIIRNSVIPVNRKIQY